ncbi:MAG: hypothetical protein ABJB47_08885 [Actinomycetota bacterium]
MGHPGLGERVRAGQRAERFRTAPDLPAYFRKPWGPGWALAGDAGLPLDPITGQGISDAFRDAELLAGAVAAGLGGELPVATAMTRYQRERDRAGRPMYDFIARPAALEPPRPAGADRFRALAASPADAEAFIGALTGTVPLPEFMSPRNLARLVGVRGVARLMLSRPGRRSTPPAVPAAAPSG